MFSWLPGADLNSVVQREIKDLNDTRTGSADRTGAWNWQDDIGAWMAGSSKEEVLRLAQKKANEDLAKILQPEATKITSQLGGLTPSYTGVTGKTAEQLRAELDLDSTRATALQTAMAQNPNFDPSTLSSTATAGQILQASSKATQTRTETKEQEERDRQTTETRRREGRDDDRLAMTMELSRLDRKDEREARRDERAYQNRKLDLQEARLDRKDRQAAIQQMMAGLAQLGASIAI